MGITDTRPASGKQPPGLGAIRKLRTASRRLTEVEATWQAYLAETERGWDVRADPGTRTIEFVVRFSNDPPTEDYADVLRAVVHDARSALDNVVYDLSVLAGAGGQALRRNAFPVVDDVRRWGQSVKSGLVGIPPSTVERVRAVQPFARPVPPGVLHPLVLLHELWNADKHRQSFHVAVVQNSPAGTHRIGGMTMEVPAPHFPEVERALSDVDAVVDLETGPIVDGTTVLRVRLPDGVDVQSVEAEFPTMAFSLSIVAGDADPWSPVMPALGNALRYSREIIRYLIGALDVPPVVFPEGFITEPPR